MWEVFALRYAMDPARQAPANFLGGAPPGPMPVAYHVFFLRGAAGLVVVDTGATSARLRRKGREPGHTIEDALTALGSTPDDVAHVIQTHLHWDHAGNTALFPRATFHLQAREMAYVTGPAMRHPLLRAGYEAEDVAAMTTLLHEGRLDLVDGPGTLLETIRLTHVGGHTNGLQVVDLPTARGRLCLAGDAVAFRENLVRRDPFPALYHVGAALDAFETVAALADTPDLVIPGHDPWIVDAHPPATQATRGWLARLS